MATATLLPAARFVVFDANGNPVPGALVHTYIPATTTPKTTWQDAAEATPNANPIVCDAAGSCLLYGSGAYQITVTDALGVAVPGYSGLTADTLSAVTTETTRALAAEGANTTAITAETTRALAAEALLTPTSGFASSFGTSSYTKLPNGYIRQFGTGTTDGTGRLSVTFPITFPTAIRSYGAAIIVSSFGSSIMAQAGAASTSTLNVLSVAPATGAGIAAGQVSWWAEGN
jgi:hypothetical protein